MRVITKSWWPGSLQTGMVEMSEAFKHKGAEVYLEPASLS